MHKTTHLLKRLSLPAALALSASMLLAACLAEPTPVPATPIPGGGGQIAATTPASTGGTAATATTYTGSNGRAAPTTGAGGDRPYAGTTVTIFGAAVEEQARLFQQEFEAFTERTGINVVYEGSRDFETEIALRVEGDKAPDIAQFAQPDLLVDFVHKGKVVNLNTFMDRETLSQHYAQSFLDLATVDGKMAGIWHSNDVKSLVWYPKKAFDQKGYKVPATWDELLKLSDRIVADGSTPWCVGIESGGATGWAGTDWVEDALLRTTAPENYDRWVRGDLKFSSPEVKQAFEMVGNIWFKDGYVYGGRESIVTTSFSDAPKPMFENPPGCWLHRQSSFITNYFPTTARVGEDVAYFYLPPVGTAGRKPVLGWGTISAMFNDRPEVREVMQFLASGESVKVEAQAGIAVAPHKDASLGWYPNETIRGYARILQGATVFRLDGSDLMPGAVGTGSFWKGIVDWVGGADLDTVLKTIDESWPSK